MTADQPRLLSVSLTARPPVVLLFCPILFYHRTATLRGQPEVLGVILAPPTNPYPRLRSKLRVMRELFRGISRSTGVLRVFPAQCRLRSCLKLFRDHFKTDSDVTPNLSVGLWESQETWKCYLISICAPRTPVSLIAGLQGLVDVVRAIWSQHGRPLHTLVLFWRLRVSEDLCLSIKCRMSSQWSASCLIQDRVR